MLHPSCTRVLLLVLCLAAAAAGRDVVAPELRAAMAQAAPGVRLPAYVVMADQLTAAVLAQEVRGLTGRARRAAVAQALQAHADASQPAVRALLASAQADGRAGAIGVLWMGNAVTFEAEPAVIDALAGLPGVDRIRLVVNHGPEAYEDSAPADGSYPFADNFESGVLQPHWTVSTTGAGTATVTAADGPIGGFHLELDSATDGVDAVASVTVSLDLTGQSDVGIRFDHKEFSDEDNDEDGVFVSDDGITWVKAKSLNGGTSSYLTHSIELDPLAAGSGLVYGPGFQVRFQWRDNFGIPTDGFALDNIQIAPGVGTAPPPPPEPNLVALQAAQLWDLGVNGGGVLIGTLDSGTWISHPDLVNRIWTNPGEVPGNGVDDDGNGFIDDLHGWDFLSNGADVTAGDPHGTNTAGIICGDGSSGGKLTGMAPGATLLVCEVLTDPHYWAAQQYCLQQGVDVITSSFSYKVISSPKPDYPMFRQLCEVELAAGIVHANSIGNQGQLLSSYPVPFNIATPGNCPSPFDHPALVNGGRSSIIACGGIELPFDALYSSSGVGPAAWEDLNLYFPGYPWPQDPADWDYPYGGFGGGLPGVIKPDVVAYTTNIQTTTIGSGYAPFGGTSAATPHVGGALCLLLDSQPEAQPRHLAAALELTAKDLGAPGKDIHYGSGKIQVYDAARRLVVLGHFDDIEPAAGGPVVLDVFGRPNVPAWWLASLSLVDNVTDLNLATPWFVLGVVPLRASGHATLTLVVPNDSALVGLTVWSQFTQKDATSEWGPGRLWSVPESLTIQ
jgi:subtilisin family serine protease